MSENLLDFTIENVDLSFAHKVYDPLQQAYTEPHRAYHNLKHIQDCLALFQEYYHLAQYPEEVTIAIWFHDAIYDTHAKDNEEQSAAWAVRYLREAGAAADRIQRIKQLIIGTKTHAPLSADSALLNDIDLSILGRDTDTFANYNQAIRQEYSWAHEQDYKAGRTKVLKSFLDLPCIYHTNALFERFEAQARINISQAIAELFP